MQIKISYVMEPDFIPAFDELLKKPMPAKQCLEMITSSEKITEEYNRLMKAQLLVLQQYCVMKDDGTLKFDDKGNVVFKDKESETAGNKEVADLKSGTIEIPLTNKVKVYDDDVSTPRKIFLLKDLIEIVERPAAPLMPGQEVKK
jgi:hypothetical protein